MEIHESILGRVGQGHIKVVSITYSSPSASRIVVV